MAVAGRPEDRAVVGRASPLLRLRVYRVGDTHTYTHTSSETCRDSVHTQTESSHLPFTRVKKRV